MISVSHRSTSLPSLLFTLLFCSILLAACQGGEEEKEQTGENRPDTSRTNQNYLLSQAHYDSLSHNPAPLVGGANSLEELVQAGLEGLQKNDTALLARIMITPDEFRNILLPELGKHWPGARDTRETIQGWIIQNHFGSAEKGLLRAIRDLGGETYRLDSLTFGDVEQNFPSFDIYQKTTLHVTNSSGKPGELHCFGSVVRKDSIYKFLSYRDDD